MIRDSCGPLPKHVRRSLLPRPALTMLCGFFWVGFASYSIRGNQATDNPPIERISKAASDRCDLKVKSLEALTAAPEPRKKQTTRFTEEEINSYLALELKSKYHPSLRSLEFTFEENRLKGIAAIDFDKLSMSSTRLLGKLIARLFSGVHSLSIAGKLKARSGEANFELEEARFDSSVLPNFLVEEIITAVGQKQKPPFDPIRPSKMPYSIDRVETRHGHIVVYQ